MTSYEMTNAVVEKVEEFVALINHEHPNESSVMSMTAFNGWEVREVPTGDNTPMIEVFVSPRVSAMVWFDKDGGHAEW